MDFWSETLFYKTWIDFGNWLASINISFDDVLVFCLDSIFVVVAVLIFSFLIWKLMDFIAFVIGWILENL